MLKNRMSYWYPTIHKPSERTSFNVPLGFPTKSILISEIEEGITKECEKELNILKFIPEYTAEYKDTLKFMELIRKGSVPLDGKVHESLSRFYATAVSECPLKESLIDIRSLRIGRVHPFRLVYEVYNIDGEEKILFTNINAHVYRNWLYSHTKLKDDYYRNMLLQ